MLMFLYSFFIAIFYVESTITSRDPICNSLQYTGAFVSNATGKTLYSYAFDCGISVNPNNSTFPNKLRITNYERWSSNPSKIYQAAPLIFAYPGVMNQCPKMNETCFIDFPNTYSMMFYPLMLNGTLANYESNARPFISNGNIFDGYYGTLMDPNKVNNFAWNDPYGSIKYKQAVKCTNFYYINVPEDNYGNCINFKSVTTVTDSVQNTTVTLNANYVTTFDGFNVTITNFTSSPIGFSYIHGPNILYWQGIGGTTKNPIQNYSIGYYSTQNYQIEWTLDLSLPGYYSYPRLIVGELIQRNRIFYKNDNIPYTVSDPCFKLKYVTSYSKNATVKTEFCCTLFETK
uniref:Uncharacterized protein n=1 Tax=Panagrolaimus davidi TaxID=227884 RepID=A0A914R4Y0_9BILA